ncbi:MAG TPA: HAD family hydrolase [Gemmatimonadaceae bacterium]|nr:HAD family hydrolase [Gemmatimonadaceae bacterium]
MTPAESRGPCPRPTVVLFDLFHTLVSVPSPARAGELAVAEILGVSREEWQRRYYDEDILGRCLGRVCDPLEAMRGVAHTIDPFIPEERIVVAAASRRRRFTRGLVEIEPTILAALDRLRGAGIRIALVSDAGADDVEAWALSPLRERFNATVFSYEIGIRKPAPAIYQRALDALDAPAADAMFVGDGGSDEHRGARAVGMRSVLVTRLIERPTPETLAARRAHADWEFEDVPAFVAALGL